MFGLEREKKLFHALYKSGRNPKALLFGQSGVGKTLFAAEAADELGAELEVVSPQEIEYHLETALRYKRLFKRIVLCNEAQTIPMKSVIALLEITEHPNCPPVIFTAMNTLFGANEFAFSSRMDIVSNVIFDKRGFGEWLRNEYPIAFYPNGASYREMVKVCQRFEMGFEPLPEEIFYPGDDKPANAPTKKNEKKMIAQKQAGYRAGQKVYVGKKVLFVSEIVGDNIFADENGDKHWISSIRGTAG